MKIKIITSFILGVIFATTLTKPYKYIIKGISSTSVGRRNTLILITIILTIILLI